MGGGIFAMESFAASIFITRPVLQFLHTGRTWFKMAKVIGNASASLNQSEGELMRKKISALLVLVVY